MRAAPKSWSKYTTIDLEIKGSKRAYCPPLTLGSVFQVSTTRLSTLLDLWPFESGLVCIFRRVRASHIERTSRVIEPVFQRALEKIFAGIFEMDEMEIVVRTKHVQIWFQIMHTLMVKILKID